MADGYKALCPDCGRVYTPSQAHHRAAYGGCCRTFTSDNAYEHHLGPEGCLEVETIPGWRIGLGKAWTNSKPMTKEAWQARQAAGTHLPPSAQAVEGRTPPPRSPSTGTPPKPSESP